jgi:hypothetical protein
MSAIATEEGQSGDEVAAVQRRIAQTMYTTQLGNLWLALQTSEGRLTEEIETVTRMSLSDLTDTGGTKGLKPLSF